MHVVKEMGERYLWVDKLCITQHPSTKKSKDEKWNTIENMGRIYSQARFTIVDGDSQGSQGGLFKDQARQNAIDGQVIAKISTNLTLFLPTHMPNDLAIWESRAWTFQEKVLSRKILVFSGGFAQWQCQEGVWREDVNARDVNVAPVAISHAYLRQQIFSPEVSEEERFGLRNDEMDGSIRLYRTPAFSQYAQCVHDYTKRTIRDSGEVLNACAGILSILTSKEFIDSELLYGLPCKFIDTALLWQHSCSIRRRKMVQSNSLTKSKEPPPSWSWAGWEQGWEPHSRAQALTRPEDEESQGPKVFYRTPYEVFFDEEGIKMHLRAEGEERLRPVARIFSIPEDNKDFPQLGLLGQAWMESPQSGLLHSRPAYDGWDFRRIRDLPPSHFLEMSDQALGKTPLTNKHLVVCTEEAILHLGAQWVNVRQYAKHSETQYPDINAESTVFRIPTARERGLFVNNTSERLVGVASHSVQQPSRNARIAVRAILLSEAQYLGNEERPDVMGYPLYNVMLIEEVNEGSGIMERVGLGKVRKSAWTQAKPRSRTILLG